MRFTFLLLLSTFSAIAVAKPDDDDKDKGKRFDQPVEELFLTDTLHPQAVGEWEFHLIGNAMRRFRDTRGLTSVEYGVTGQFQVSAASPSFVGGSDWSFADSSAEALYTVMPNNDPFAVGLLLSVGSTDGPGPRTLQDVPSVLVARAFGRFEVHTQFGTAVSSGSNPGYFYAVAGMLDAERWTPTLEFNDLVSAGQRSRLLTPGLYYHFTRKLEFGFAAPIRLYGGTNTPSIIAIVTWNL